MFSEPLVRSALAEHLHRPATGGVDQQAVRDYIREQKADGRLIERRVYVDPARSRKRRVVYQYVAVNLELEF